MADQRPVVEDRAEEAAPSNDLLDQPSTSSSEVSLPTLSAMGWARWAWRQLISMRTALMLLFLLALAALPGSMLPQRRDGTGRVDDYLDAHTTVGPWLDRFSFFDVYSSPWFSAVYLLLFISLVGCVLPRARIHWRAMRSGPPATPRRLTQLPTHQRIDLAQADPQQVLAQAATYLRSKRYRVRVSDDSVSAERGYLAETGNLIFHLSLLGVLISFAWGSLGSYAGQVIVVQGNTFANVLPQYDTFTAGTLVDTDNLEPFSATLGDFNVQFEAQAGGNQMGAPREFDATFTVQTTPDGPTHTQVVRPNHPLDVNGTRVFLVGNGYAPKITVKDGDGNVIFSGPVITRPLDGNYRSALVLKMPDAQPRQLGLQGVFAPTYQVEDGLPVSAFPQPLAPKLVLRVLYGRPSVDDLGANTGAPQSVFRINAKNMTQLNGSDGQPATVLLGPGESSTLPAAAGGTGSLGEITFDGLTRYAALDVRHDPSKLWALATSMLALAGVSLSLFVRRRRLFVRVRSAGSDSGPGTVLEVAGLARGQDDTVGQDVEELAAALSGTKP